MRILHALLLFLFLLPAAAQAELYRVTSVVDGDTIAVVPLQGGERVKVRLHGIDAPEFDQPHGLAATVFLIETVLYKEVDVRPTAQGTDRYGRIAAVVKIPGGDILQKMLLKAGLAWVWPQSCRDCKAWEKIQARAKKRRKGLWADENPMEPWRWRAIK